MDAIQFWARRSAILDINNLKAFIEVADKKSFSRSAESLHLTQPAVSKRIAALETELSARLFDRIGRTVHLTEAGRVLLPSARQISAELARIEDVICNLGKNISGKLSMGTSHQIGLHRLPPFLKSFRHTYPEVDIDIRFSNSAAALDSVENGELEMALCATDGDLAPKLREIDVWTENLVFVVAPDHPLASEEHVDLALLTKCPAVLPEPPSVTRQTVESHLLSQDKKPTVMIDAGDLETMKMMVAIGLGWGCLPDDMIDDTVVVIDVDDMVLQRKISLVRHNDRTLSRAAQAFMETLPV
jgi:DNA-binding transcriptional LysR family regulator